MIKTRTQMRIEDFLRDLSIISQKYGMIVDANGDQSKGSPLALYSRIGKASKYKKIGFLHYDFEGDTEQPIYNFDPKETEDKLQKTEVNQASLENKIDIPIDLQIFDGGV